MTAVLDPELVEATPDDTDNGHVHVYDVESSWIPEGAIALCGHVNKTAGRATLTDRSPANICPPCDEISTLNGLFYGGGA